MVPQGPSSPLGGSQSTPPLLRSNSGIMPSHNSFQSLVSPQNQVNSNTNMLGNLPSVSSLLRQSFGNGALSPGISQRGGAESDPLSNVANGMGFNHYSSSSSYTSPSISANPSPSGQIQGQQQLDPQNLPDTNQSQFSVPGNPQQARWAGGLGGTGPITIEPQATHEQTPQHLRNLGHVKFEPQQIQGTRGVGPVKMEPHHQHSDSSLLLHQRQLNSMRQSTQSAAAAQLLHQQRLLQIQHQQRSSMQQTQFQQQNMPSRSPVKPVYEPGMCARRLTHYMYQHQHRPEDNNIEFWRKFVAEYFAPNAKKKWCVSMYGSGRPTNGVFPQDVWHCEICNRKPGRGFEATFEVLPRLFKIKYESGTLEELLYVDMPREYQNSSGQIVLDYAKAIQESVFEQLRVVRDGQLRIVFSSDLKICSWEFCARRHEELIPRKLLIPQVSQLGAAAQKCQAASQNTPATVSISELQNNCNMFVSSARQLAKALEVQLVNDLGYTKRYVRCLQISEVVNSMKDLIDYSRETGIGPMESLIKFPRKTNPSPSFQNRSQQAEGQPHQTMAQIPNETPSEVTTNENTPSVNNTPNSVLATTSSANTIACVLRNNDSINSRLANSIPHNPDASDSQSSVQKIIHDMMMSSHLVDTKNVNGIGGTNGGNTANGIRTTIGNNGDNSNNSVFSMNGRVGMMMTAREQSMSRDLGNQLIGGVRTVNGFNDIEFDWKGSP